MAIKLRGLLSFFVWIGFIPIRRQQKPPLKHGHQNNKDEPSGVSSVESLGWELNLFSKRCLPLLLGCIGADAGYLYFVISVFTKRTGHTIFNYCIFSFKILSMTIVAFFPWFLGTAACWLGPLALPLELTVSKRDLAKEAVPPVLLSLGLMCLHAHSLVKYPLGAIPVILSALLSGLGYFACIVTSFAWLQDFLQATHAVGRQTAVTVAEAAAIQVRFEQLKTALSEGLFYMLVVAQLSQIFSTYSALSGECGIVFQYCLSTGS
jgi:hypothetical protein